MRKIKKKWLCSMGGLAAFAVWTTAVRFVNVQPIGPGGSLVGFAGMNLFVHQLIGVHMLLYIITDWLGLIPIGICMGFGVLGLAQWIHRKELWKVDRSLLVLGGFYVAVIAVYAFFETFVINYRPVLIEGILEASYPSSTTMLVLCVVPTAMMQLKDRIRNRMLKRSVLFLLASFIAFMVVGRLISGVHWFTDIVGGVLLSSGLVMTYDAVCGLFIKK